MLDLIAHSEQGALEAPLDVDEFRLTRLAVPLEKYELFEITAGYLSSQFQSRLDQALTGPSSFAGFVLETLDPPIDWFAHNRSIAFHLGAWNPVSNFLIGHSQSGKPEYFAKAWNFALSWLREFQVPAFETGPDPARLVEKFGPTPWYDMAVGQRVYRIAYMLDHASRHSEYADSDIRLLYRAMIFHLRLLERDDFFQLRNNHGLYQALGELAAGRRFRDRPYVGERYEISKKRVAEVIDFQFHEGGIHREHSPGYHFMILFTIIGARQSGVLEEAGLEGKVSQLEEMLTWMIQGNGNLLTLGDTDPRSLKNNLGLQSIFQDPGLRWYCSSGEVGHPPPAGLRVLPAEGYVFARSPAPTDSTESWWYFAQTASFHSRVHKHADDLSFVWSDRGSEILIDPARYAYAGRTEAGSVLQKLGFWYGDPKRIYVESTAAHNTVEIDGQSYNRMRKPYGSALRDAREQDGAIVTECETYHSRTVRHWRLMVLAPSRYLLVVDWLHDRSSSHDFRQNFHFHPSWSVGGDGGPGLLARRDDPARALRILALTPGQGAMQTFRGQLEPEMRGWHSDRAYSVQPCTTLCSEQVGTDLAMFATLFTFATDAIPGATSVLRSMRPSRFSWIEGDEAITVKVVRSIDGSAPAKVEIDRTPRDSANSAAGRPPESPVVA